MGVVAVVGSHAVAVDDEGSLTVSVVADAFDEGAHRLPCPVASGAPHAGELTTGVVIV